MSKTRSKSPANSRSHAVAPTAAEQAPTFRGAVLPLAGLFLLALAVRGLHFLFMRQALVYEVLICDAWQYDQWAQKIAGGEWLGSEVFYQTPLYPYLIGVLYAVCGHSVWVVRIAQAVLDALACVMLAKAGTHFFSPRIGWIGGVLLALYPPAIFFDGILQKAALDLVLVTGLLWALGVAQSRPGLARFVVVGLLLGLLILNRENAAILAPVLLAWIVWLTWSQTWARRAAYGLVYLLGLAAVLVPVGVRNWHVGGAFLLTTSQFGPNFYMGNHEHANGLHEPLRPGRADPRFESMDARMLAEQALERSLTSSEVSRYWSDRTWSDIARDPVRWLRLLGWKFYLIWNTIELIDGEGIRVHQQSSPLLWGLSWLLSFGVLCPLALLGAWWTRVDWRRLLVVYAVIGAFAAAITLFFILARYRYPLVPPITLFAAAGLAGLWDRLRSNDPARRRQLVVAVACAVPVVIACNWPLVRWYNDEVTYFNIGTALMDAGRPQDAIAPLLKSVSSNPPAAYNNLGRAALSAGDTAQARRWFAMALEADPKLAIGYLGLGDVAEKVGDKDEAIRQLKKAVALDPLMAIAFRTLGRLELERGDVEAAVEHRRRVVELNPKVAVVRAELGMALMAQGNLSEAISELRLAAELTPPSAVAANNLAWILATAPEEAYRNGAEAVRLAEENCRATDYKLAELLDTLAAAYAEHGQFDQAAEQAARAIELARQDNNAPLADSLTERRRLYLARQAYRDPSLKRKP